MKPVIALTEHDRRSFGCCAALIGLGAAVPLLLVALLIAAPPVEAAQAEVATIEVSVSGNKIELTLTDIVEPIGALELTIAGLPPLDGECKVTGGFGACNDQGQGLRVVAVNPTGFDVTTELANAKLEDDIDEAAVAVNVVQITDVAGQTVVARTSVVSRPSSGGGFSTAAWVAVPVIAVAAALIGWRAVARGNKPRQADS